MIRAVHHPCTSILACFPNVDSVRTRVRYDVPSCRLCRISEERVRRGLHLIRRDNCQVINLCSSDQRVHEFVQPLLPLGKCSPPQKFCSIVGNRAVDNHESHSEFSYSSTELSEY